MCDCGTPVVSLSATVFNNSYKNIVFCGFSIDV